MMTRRRRLQGYTDLGPVQVPPRPRYIIMTDRADGTKWLLTHNLVDGPDADGRIALSNTLPTTPDKVVYGAYEGPYVQESTHEQGSPVLRLLVREGHLGYEEIGSVETRSIDNAPAITRQLTGSVLREVIVPTAWRRDVGALGWRTL